MGGGLRGGVSGISVTSLLVGASLGATDYTQPEVTPSPGGGAFVPGEDLRDVHEVVMYVPSGGSRTLPITGSRGLSFISAFPHC